MDPGEPALLFRSIPAALRPTSQERRELKTFAAQVSKKLADGKAFTCLLTNDSALQKLNRDFLGHDYPTDVLSFPSPDGADELGDLAISTERAHAQATSFGHSTMEEYRVLMLHGVLHLLGYDHETDRGEMNRTERKWRTQLGLPNTLIERTRKGARNQ